MSKWKAWRRVLIQTFSCLGAIFVISACASSGSGSDNGGNNNGPINHAPIIAVSCPASASELNAFTCPLTVSDEDTGQTLSCSFDPASTCQGAVLVGCLTVNVPAQGEAGGPGSCVVAVNVQDDFSPPGSGQGSDSIIINEANQNPIIAVDCPSNVGETGATTCALTASDPDLPAQNLTCSLNDSTTCVGVTLTGCTQADVPAQWENAGPGSCTVMVDVHDDFAPQGTGQGSDTITINEANQDPTITLDCPSNVSENSATSCDITVADGDLPSQVLSCSRNASTTCTGVTLVGCAQANVSAQGELATGSCAVVIDVRDNFVPSGAAQGTDIISIDKTNQNPNWDVLPSNISVIKNNSYAQNNGRGADGDLPNTVGTDDGYLTCVKDVQTCSFDISVSGAGGGSVDCNLSFVSGPSLEACGVTLRVTDGSGASITADVYVTVRDPRVWYVDASATGANSGLSWTDAFTSIQEGADMALSGDSVWVAQGTYINASGIATKEVLFMKAGVGIYGGFVGIESSLSQRGDPSAHLTILDGQNMSSHVVVGASNSLIDGFTIKNGNAIGEIMPMPYCPSPDGCVGGGMYNANVDNLSVVNCIFSNNKAISEGGGIYCINASGVQISNCSFSSNTAIGNPLFMGGVGGAIFSSDTSLTISGCIFTSNSAGDIIDIDPLFPPGGGGGAIYTSGGQLNLINSIFGGNIASYSGGGIGNNTPSSFITGCSFFGNFAIFRGGAIYNTPPLLTNCIFSSNSTDGTSVPGFSAGGAIYSGFAPAQIVNCLFYNNSSGMGGAISDYDNYSGNTDFNIVNCTFSRNVAWNETTAPPPSPPAGYGGALYVTAISHITNSILWADNATTQGSETYGTVSGSYNCGALDPLFISSSDLHLQSGSPCIDSGTATGAPADDLDGYLRPYPALGAFDIGAYEWHP